MMKRVFWIDFFRTLAILNMIVYHGMWDAIYLFGYDLPSLYTPWAIVWERYICISFFVLSGICFNMSRSNVKRGIFVSVCGLIVTLVTVIFVPQGKIIFGTLTFIGLAHLLLCPIFKSIKVNPYIGMFVSLMLFILTYSVPEGQILGVGLPKSLYSNLLTALVGFPPNDFSSADYFPIMPWIFVFLFGCFLGKAIKPKAKEIKEIEKPIVFISRNSIYIYMVHQAVLYGLFTVIDIFARR